MILDVVLPRLFILGLIISDIINSHYIFTPSKFMSIEKDLIEPYSPMPRYLVIYLGHSSSGSSLPKIASRHSNR